MGEGTMAGALLPIERQTLAETVIERLRAYIRDNGLGPGDVLPPQHELARRLGVSRPVLREALQGLATLGLIEIRPGSGCYVRDPHAGDAPDGLLDVFSHEAALEVLEARLVVEVELAGLAATRASDRDFANLEHHLGRLERAVARGRPTAQITSDFHQALARAGHNAVLFRMAQLLERPRLAQGLRVEHALPDVSRHEYESHRGLSDAVRSGDVEVARAAMREHLAIAHGWEERIDALRREITAEAAATGRSAARATAGELTLAPTR